MLTAALLVSTVALARPKPKGESATQTAPIDPPFLAATSGRVIEYQGDEIGLVLRTLARQAKINLLTDSRIKGSVTIRLEDKTPREAIDIIVTAKDLITEEVNGVIFVKMKNAPPEEAPAPEKSFEEAITETLTPAVGAAVTKLMDTGLDYLARPETAQKLARAKKQLYDALVAEGFTKEEAMKILLSNPESIFPGGSK